SVVDAAIDVAPAGAGDVVIAVGLFRYVRSTVRLLEAARGAGATTIGITDNRLSPLAPTADLLLVAATQTDQLSNSLTALMALTNVLVKHVARANPERVLDGLRRVDGLYDAFEILLD